MSGKTIDKNSLRNIDWLVSGHGLKRANECIKCGKCEEACVLEEAAIKVLPMQLAKGVLGHHYRFGWQEKDKAGHSLFEGETISLPVRQPEVK